MAEDDRDFIEQTQSKAQLYHGKELSPEEMANEFAKFGIDERVDALDRISADSNGELTIDQAARRYPYERALRNRHEMLRKADR